jgi:hypothetical protein
MRTLLLISAITAMGMGPGLALADPGDSQGHSCIGTGCKAVYDDDNPLPPDFEAPGLPGGDICMELVGDDATPPEEQWDGCILP